jgi:hypothetical protein
MSLRETCALTRRLFILATALAGGVGALVSPTTLRAQPSTTQVADLPADAEARLATSNMLRQGVMRMGVKGNFLRTKPSTLGEYLLSVQHLFQLPQPQHPVSFI